MPRQLLGTAIAANTITTTQLQTTVVNQISAGGGPRVSSLIYPGNDTAGNTVGGQTVYINGVAGSTTTSAATLATSTLPLIIGASGGGLGPFNGYIDDLRITKGYARYTSNFTPPTSALKDK